MSDNDSLIITPFDYDALDMETRIVVQQLTGEIKARLRYPKEDILKVRVYKKNRFYPCQIIINGYVRQMDGRHIVYGLFDPLTQTIIYVGRTGHVMARLKQHCRVNPNSCHLSRLEKRKMDIAASKSYVVAIILRVCENEQEADEAEQEFLHRYRNTILNVQLDKWIQVPKYD